MNRKLNSSHSLFLEKEAKSDKRGGRDEVHENENEKYVYIYIY